MKSCFLLLLPLLVGAAAAPSDAADAPPEAAQQVRAFVATEVARAQPGLRSEITVGDLDARLHLAPCASTEVYLRPGTRLWGRSFVGYRCTQRPFWSVSVPVIVRVFGTALVAARPLPALQALSPKDVRLQEVELSREPAGVATDLAQLEDRQCTRSLEPDMAIPLSCLRTLPAVDQGDAVKLVGVGSGFTISTDATALATAAAGEAVRVRVESGRTLSGIARKGRIVEVGF